MALLLCSYLDDKDILSRVVLMFVVCCCCCFLLLDLFVDTITFTTFDSFVMGQNNCD